jgi:hypothetical protein
VLRASGLPWAVIEVQHEVDDIKRRRWPLVASVLLDEHQAMGEFLVLTYRRRVAMWARLAISWLSARGTRLALSPLVIPIDLDEAERLLNEGEPAMALVAAWALQGKCGPRSKALAVRAVERTATLPAPVRPQQGRAIMQLLSDPLRRHLRTMLLKGLDQVPQSKSFKKFMRSIEGPAEERGKAEGEAKGKAEALLKYLDRRGVVLTAERRQHVASCTDLAQLDCWLELAFDVSTRDELVEAIFGPAG